MRAEVARHRLVVRGGDAARPISATRAWLHFLLIGLVLVAARQALGGDPEPPPVLLVPVPASASPAAVERAVDEEILVDLAIRSGWAEDDPLVVERLVRNLRFGDERSAGEPRAVQLARATDMGMERSDPVARGQLVQLARRALGASAATPPPSDDELSAWMRAHPDRYARPATVRFSQLLVSRQRHGAHLETDAEALGARLAAERPAPSEARALSDPTLLPHQLGPLDVRRIDARFGAGFGRQLLEAEPGRWVGPLRSTFGLHYAWVHERSGRRLPAVGEIRPALVQDLIAQRRRRQVRSALDGLRQSYRIELVRTP